MLFASIQDDGIGCNPTEIAGRGLGTLNMRQRADLLKGTIEWVSEPGKGTLVSIHIPITDITQDVVEQKSNGRSWLLLVLTEAMTLIGMCKAGFFQS